MPKTFEVYKVSGHFSKDWLIKFIIQYLNNDSYVKYSKNKSDLFRHLPWEFNIIKYQMN